MRKVFLAVRIRFVSVLAWISGLSVFIPLGSLILVMAFVVDSKRFDPFIKACCRLLVHMLFIRVLVEGRYLLNPQKTYIFISNHVNLFDVFILNGYIPNYIRAVELDEHFRWPLYGQIIARIGNIPISHKNARLALESLRKAQQAVSGGTSIVILPEGGRTLDGSFKPFKRGAFLLAKEAGVDIVPVVMTGAYKINRKGSLIIYPGKMVLRFGEPVRYGEIKNMEVNKLRHHIREIMERMMKE
ncbi:1-acyl-sn-glycerol-3-phosphate acyltransferase [candidate division KSB1 bacterium]|nr:1-acyl-sn-glycerol-3-phosphate acyltransferase [candidate division KSB1 bacterium]